MVRCRCPFVLVAAVLGLLAGPGYGQDRPVDLRLTLAQGEVLYYTITATGGYTPPPRTERLSYREAVRVLGIEADGTVLVEVVGEEFRKPDGSPLDEIGEPQTFKVRPDGKVVERVSGRDPDDFPIPLPTRSLVPGEAWSRPNRMTLGFATFDAPLRGTGPMDLPSHPRSECGLVDWRGGRAVLPGPLVSGSRETAGHAGLQRREGVAPVA